MNPARFTEHGARLSRGVSKGRGRGSVGECRATQNPDSERRRDSFHPRGSCLFAAKRAGRRVSAARARQPGPVEHRCLS